MAFRPHLAVLLIATLSVTHAEEGVSPQSGYRLVHPDGSIEFSDEPIPGGEAITLPGVSVYSHKQSMGGEKGASPGRNSNNDRSSSSKAPKITGYSHLSILSPSNGETRFFNAAGLVVSLSLTPSLNSTHKIRILLDGSEVATGGGLQFNIGNVYRGSHTLSAQVIDATGTPLIESAPTTFYLRQFSKLHKKSREEP